jgi:hypothetical protein
MTLADHGILAGPAQTARQVKVITVRVEQINRGVFRVTQAATPGWAGVARNPHELARAVAAAFNEAQLATHAGWRNTPYEAPDGQIYRRPPRPGKPGHRSDVHDPREWVVVADGRWRDPGSGRLWRPDSQVVRRVQHRRMQLGLPSTPSTDPSKDHDDSTV